METASRSASPSRARSLTIIAACQVAAMALWFSASAVVPSLKATGAVDDTTASLFTSAVQLGFVVGTLISAFFGLADRFDPRRFFAASAAVAALANAGILAVDITSPAVIALRFVTGVCMAGIYPVGMKLATTWARGDMGLMVGLLVGALTLGSAAPHLFNAFGGIDWRSTLLLASGSAAISAAAIGLAELGPNLARAPRFDPASALRGWTSPSLRLANIGYLGHMWELYAMWAWIVVFLDASFRLTMTDAGVASALAATAAFAAIGAGAVGCVAGGFAADRWGRTTVTIVSMAISGSCALLVGAFFGASPLLLTIVCIVWGVTIVSDSAQFSASIAELSEPSLVGTMLTAQTCLGFLLTLATIHLMPAVVSVLGWEHAFAVLALGPAVGVVAMCLLRRHPDAVRLAGGRR